MKLVKAIEILEADKEQIWHTLGPDLTLAHQLGIEALVLYRNLRQDYPDIVPKSLNGETEE